MAAPDLHSPPAARFSAPPDGAFPSGLRNIRRAIELRLEGLGIKDPTLGDTAGRCARPEPSMVIIDVAAGGRSARVTFTRDEVEDCARCVDVHCVRRKIDRLVEQLGR